MREELTAWTRSWWCRGCGAAVLALLAAVSVFRNSHDAIFWIAIGFFAVHTVMAVLRYRRERRLRAGATVIRYHRTHSEPSGSIIFIPQPINSLIPLDTLPQQTKKAV